MFFTILSPATLKTLIWLVVMILVDYAAVITAIMIDFRSGVLRARRRGIPRTSKGYRRSVDKAARYLVTLLASSAIDACLWLRLCSSAQPWDGPSRFFLFSLPFAQLSCH